jgi:hypothetical protein
MTFPRVDVKHVGSTKVYPTMTEGRIGRETKRKGKGRKVIPEVTRTFDEPRGGITKENTRGRLRGQLTTFVVTW